ncbi:MAG: hypothetical protein DWH81_05715 [Planctomycetota bacterium]|jgi:hypothetical protein|nr:MAG: hypothetical protein DWH81_05715 [Planctomycetota bacterium]
MSPAEQAKSIYEYELKGRLVNDHFGKFVAIESVSRDYFLGDTFMDAALAAKSAHPQGKPFVIRIGHDAAVHIGAAQT